MSSPEQTGSKAVRILKHEIAAMLPPLVVFLIGFNLISFTLGLALEPYGITYGSAIKASVGALIIAKVVLIVDHLPFFRAFAGRPLVRPILYRTLVYSVFTMAVHELEEIVRAWVHDGSLGAGLQAWQAAFIWQHFTFVAIWVAVLFFAFVTFDETRRAYGLPTLPRILWASGDER